MTAYGYIRKSVVHDPARMLSPEMQEAEIRRLASYNGHEDIVVLSDLDISGTKDRSARPGWNEVLTAIESGECKDLYAYSMSRLARSVDQLSAVRKLCTKHGVGLHLVREKVDTSSASGRLFWNLQASFEEFWADVTSERVKDAFATKRARDPMWAGPGQPAYGERPGEDVAVVLDAFRERGSYDGAARLLNETGVPCRVRGAAWSGTVVRSIVQREAPDEVLPSVSRGAPAGKRAFRFSQLVRCSTCEKRGVRQGSKASTFLTGSWDKRRGEVRYACSRARTIPHARGWVNEAKLLPVVVAEVARAQFQWKRLQTGSVEDEARIAELDAERARVKAMFRKGHMEEAEFDAAMEEIASAESRLESRRWVRRYTIPPDVERDEPGKVNAYLRRVLASVVVDMSEPATFGPSKWVPSLTFEWKDPSMRVDQVEDEKALTA